MLLTSNLESFGKGVSRALLAMGAAAVSLLLKNPLRTRNNRSNEANMRVAKSRVVRAYIASLHQFFCVLGVFSSKGETAHRCQ